MLNFNSFYCIKTVPKAFNNRASTSKKPYINMEFHAPFMHRYSPFHMQDSGQHSINTEEAPRLQLKLSIKQFTQELCRFGYCEKATEQATLNENGAKMISTCELLLTVGKNHDRRPWPETRIFIELDSACRISKVIAMRSKIVLGNFCYFYHYCG